MNSDRQQALLHEMGIDLWQMAHPQRLQGYVSPAIKLEPSVKLLLVSPESPQGELAVFMKKVVGAMKIDLAECRHILPQQLSQLAEHQLEWVWFAGCAASSLDSVKCLTSPVLSDIDGNNQQRRALWEQMKAYA